MAPGTPTTLPWESSGSCPSTPETPTTATSDASGELPSVVWSPPPSILEAKCHPLEKYVSDEVDKYFLIHWSFKSAKERKKFVAAGFSRVTCLYFPLAKDDRIHFGCRLLTLLFLIDGECCQSVKTIKCLQVDRPPRRHVPRRWVVLQREIDSHCSR